MLSRIAESLFWIGRYLERAEDTCRILEVHLQLLLDDPSVDQEEAAASLLRVMGSTHTAAADVPTVLSALCYDNASACSIAAAIDGTRESARRARETVSTEMWESINTTWYSVRDGQLARMRPATAFKLVRERCAVISGIADSTMSHDEGWHFLVLGRSIERVDMTARLIQAASIASPPPTAWLNVLRGCGAHHAFVRTYGGVTTDRDAAEFLLLDRLFPRSMVYTLTAADEALAALESGDRRAGIEDDAQRLLGTARAALEYRSPREVLTGLPQRMADLQLVCNQASLAISRRYFEGATAALWHGGDA